MKFYAADGKTLLSQQNIEFYQAATAPDPGAAPTGKVFSGWAVTDADDESARDFTKVDSKMSLRAVFAWADEELPVVAEITNAERTASGNYTVHVKLTNRPTDTTTALLRVALKTSNDKLVQTSRETIEIGTDGTIEKDVVLKYSGDNVATVAEVEVVGLDGNYRTGAPTRSPCRRKSSPWTTSTSLIGPSGRPKSPRPPMRSKSRKLLNTVFATSNIPPAPPRP